MSPAIVARRQLCTCFKRPRLGSRTFHLVLLPESQRHNGTAAWRPSGSTSTRPQSGANASPLMLSDHLSPSGSRVIRYQPTRPTEGLPVDDDLSKGDERQKRQHISRTTMSTRPGFHRAVVAFGSNLGNRVAHIENAIASMRAAGLQIFKLSQLYETKPMYYDKQDSFLNGVAVVDTVLPPLELLSVLQRIEDEHGRVRNIDKGPRTLDLDIILYGQEQIDHERLKVPHPLMMEREFVLRPLSDVLYATHRFPVHELSRHHAIAPLTSVKAALEELRNPDDTMRNIVALSPKHPFIASNDPHQPTLIMSILNITPDSFSDGGKLSATDADNIVATAKSHIASGATVLDTGGQSTRPNATMLSVEEELRRVLPALRALRTIPEVARGNIAISLDTFYSDVARPCIAEGLVDIVNDISAGQLDPKMLATVAELRKTIVLMHMRGTPQTMTRMTDYGQKGVVQKVASELAHRIDEALAAGIPPWRIILDPGIGFAKNEQQNLTLLRAGTEDITGEFSSYLSGYPWLVGTSRKGFIGKITETADAGERVWGTAACVTAAIAGGARIVRVHDVEEMSKVAKMADALYRVEKAKNKEDKKEVEDNVIGEGDENRVDKKEVAYNVKEDEVIIPTAAGQLDRLPEQKLLASLKRKLWKQERQIKCLERKYLDGRKRQNGDSDGQEDETSHHDSELSSTELPVKLRYQRTKGGSRAPRRKSLEPNADNQKHEEHATLQLKDEGMEAQPLERPERPTIQPRLEHEGTSSQAVTDKNKRIEDGEGKTMRDQQAHPKQDDLPQISDLAPLPQR